MATRKKVKGKDKAKRKKTRVHGGHAQQHRQKNKDNPKEGSQEDISSGSTTEESRTDPDGRSQASADA